MLARYAKEPKVPSNCRRTVSCLTHENTIHRRSDEESDDDGSSEPNHRNSEKLDELRSWIRGQRPAAPPVVTARPTASSSAAKGKDKDGKGSGSENDGGIGNLGVVPVNFIENVLMRLNSIVINY